MTSCPITFTIPAAITGLIANAKGPVNIAVKGGNLPDKGSKSPHQPLLWLRSLTTLSCRSYQFGNTSSLPERTKLPSLLRVLEPLQEQSPQQ